MSKIKRINVALVVAFALIFLFQCGAWGGAPEKVRIQLKWYHQFQFAGYYAAQFKGFYKDEGLDVELIEGSIDRPPDKMVLERRAEFGIHDGGDLIFRRLQGDPMIAVAAVFQHSPYVIISRKSSGIHHPSDLVGHTIPITQDQGSASILAMFRREGINVKSVLDQNPVHFVPHPWNFDDFVAGRFVATAAYLTELPRFQRRYGYEPAIMNPLDFGIDFYGDTLFTSGDFLKDKPDVVERIRRASLKGWQYAMEHRVEIADVILALPSARQVKPDRQELLDEAQAMNNIVLPSLVEIGNMNSGRWERMAQVYREFGMVPLTSNLDGFIYSIDAEKLASRKQAQLLGGVLAAFALLFFASLVWVRMLRSQVLLRTRELANDIAARKRVEESLRQMNERYTLSTRAAHLGVWDWDLLKNELVWDDRMYELYGIKREDFTDAYEAWLKGLHLDDRTAVDEISNETQRGEREYETEFRVVWPDGSIHYLKAYGQFVRDADGKPVRMTGVNFDITERKKAEEELRLYKEQLEKTVEQRTAELLLARDAAEAANKAKSVFLANMSHEIRTPMNAILGFTQIMQRSSALVPADRENLEVIYRSGRNLLTLINDVLEMSKIEAGRIEVAFEPRDIYTLLDDVENMFRVPADAKGLQWEVKKTEQLPRHIVTDESKLRQILINLVGNALKFTEAGGVVLWADATAQGSDRLRLVIEVKDTGVGISAAELGWLFDAFRQTASGAARGGTGLGLAISRSHARLMGGDITVASVLGRGSVFRLELPIQEVARANVEIAEPRHRVRGIRPGHNVISILIVDDKPDNRLYLTRLLEPLGFVLRQATNGCEAIAVWQEWRPRLILMDIVMPLMDGREATRRIKAMPEGQEVVIVALSASAFEADREAVMAIGADDFLRKPVTAEDLLPIIGRHLNIEYDYAEETEEPVAIVPKFCLDPEMRSRFPSETLEAMREAVYRSDDTAFISLIDDLPPELDDIGAALRHAVRKFDWDSLEAFVGT